MNIEEITKLPLAHIQPIKEAIESDETQTKASSQKDQNANSEYTEVQMQNKLLRSLDERRTQLKKRIEGILQAQFVNTPITPRTVGSRGSAGVSRSKKIENFVSVLFNDQMTTENWVTDSVGGSTKNSSKEKLPNMWYQFNESNGLKKSSLEASDHTNLDYFRDLGPV